MASRALPYVAIAGAWSSAVAAADRQAMMRRYHDMTSVKGNGADACPQDTAGIVVCGRATRPEPRLPLPDERFAPGEIVRYKSEPPSAAAALAGPAKEPSRLMDTIRKDFGLVRSAVTGEDPGY